MDSEKTIDVLNTLIEINNDTIEGYERALKDTDDSDLKILFTHFQTTSYQCRTNLIDEVRRLGGTPTETTNTTGKFHRAWMDIKAAFTGDDRKAILESCEYGEGVAVETYEDVLTNKLEDLTEAQQTMIHSQKLLLVADYDKVKVLRDLMLVEAK